VGIDHNSEVIAIAKKRFNNKTIKFIIGKSTKLNVKEHDFDYALLIGIYSNLGNQKHKTLKEVYRVLKKEGILIISTYNETAFKERITYYKKINVPIRKIIGTTVYFPANIGDKISEQFTKSDLIEQFQKIGFIVLKIQKKGIGYICTLKK
jgi:ubiquinone/menaquinone biosynthesis C-methylase UbiE